MAKKESLKDMELYVNAEKISVAHNDGTQSDLYDESFIAKSGLTFTVNSDG